ncbi:hypothetical protein BJX99DRAFT_254464 [Aspergillus californicus]
MKNNTKSTSPMAFGCDVRSDAPSDTPPPYSECVSNSSSRTKESALKRNKTVEDKVLFWSGPHAQYPSSRPVSDVQGQVTERVMLDYVQMIQACEVGDVQTVQFLLDSGVSPNAPLNLKLQRGEEYPYTPLEAATRRNDIKIARALLIAGATVDSEFDSLTRLITTGEPGRQMVQLLVDFGHDIHVRDHTARDLPTLLTFAVRNLRSAQVVEVLAKIDKRLMTDKFGRASLEQAISLPVDKGSPRYYDVLRVLTREKYHMNSPGTKVPLYEAVEHGDAELVRIMLEEFRADPDVRAYGGYGDRPLQAALDRSRKFSCVDIIKLLLKARPHIEWVYNGDWDYLDTKPFEKPDGEIDIEAVQLLFDILLSQSGQAKPPGAFRSLAHSLTDRSGLKGNPEVLPLCEGAHPEKRYTKR